MRKSGLLAGCALGACLAALPGAAAAQGLQGTPVVASGTAGIATAPNYTQVVPTSAEVVINWQPFDVAGAGTIDFLPVGATAEFAEVTGTFDYTVLNRILPVDGVGNPVSRAVAFNGTVFSRIGNAPGGRIWIYSPTGIIAGPTAVFNVGSLILTTNDIPVPVGSLYGPGGLVQLQGPAGSTGFVDVQAGAQINASANAFGPAYVALVAARVVQAGAVQANGSIGYIAAEQVDLTINGGLFDFVITTGTTDLEGIVHTGTSTGPASTSAADVQRISMVALPKNDALTMMLGGSVGYTAAASAANEGSSVVLAAGFATDDPALVPANRLGSIEIGDTAFSNRLTAYATDAVDVIPGVATSFAGPATLYALNAIELTSTVSTAITAASTLALHSGAPGTGGTIDMNALGDGQITAAGGFALDATSGAANYDTVTTWGGALGGTVDILADGGTITTPLDFVVNAGAIGGDDPTLGGQGSGGTIAVRLDNSGVVGATAMTLTALGRGGGSSGTGGNGLGGTVTVTETAGQLNLGSLSLFAQGAGGDAVVRAGDGSGGTASIDLLGQAQDLDTVIIDASAAAGLPTDPAGASGHASSAPDAVRLTVARPATLTVQFGIELNADARSGIEVVPGLGGEAGGATLEAIGGGAIDAGFIDAHANTFIRADAPDIVPANSPLQQGGLASVLADTGGTIDADALTVTATALGHEATAGAGTATGGTAQVMALGGGTITVDDGLGTALLTIAADGLGAAGPVAADATGGTARSVAEDGTVTVAGDIELSAGAAMANAPAATSGEGFDATGGNAGVELLAGLLGTGSIGTGTLTVRANGDARLFFGVPSPGGDPTQGNGGDGTGGTASVLVEAGTLNSGALLIEAAGTGGASAALDAASPLVSGDGNGGTARFVLGGGTATVTTLRLEALGRGGGGAPDAGIGQLAAFAGNGTGGTANLQINGGSLTAVDADLLALGIGGPGMGHGAAGAATDGGAGTGGTASLQSPAGGAGNFTGGSLSLLANGLGNSGGMAASGAHGDGGSGIGGNASADLADGEFAPGPVTIEAIGTGGDSLAAGGRGSGGAARFALVDSAAGPSGARNLANLDIDASGVGGTGSAGVAPADIGAADLTVSVLDPAAALGLAGGLTISAGGTVLTPTAGIDAVISGAPLAVGADIVMSTAAPLTVAANQPLSAAGFVTLGGSTVTTTGSIQAGSDLAVAGPLGVTADALASGGTTLLLADGGGAVAVGNLLSAGLVTAQGGSVDLASTGSLTFADLDATAGALSVVTAGDLALSTADATGPVTLRSTTGAVNATGPINSGGALVLAGNSGIAAGTVASGGTSLLQSANGTVSIGALTSPGAVTAQGRTLDLRSPAGLTFADAQASGGNLLIDTQGNLALAQGAATGALTLSSVAGAISATGPLAGGGNVAITAPLGVGLAGLTSGGTTLLRATGGAVSVANLLSAGAVTAQGRSVDIASAGALTFADLDATAGALAVQTAGNLTVATADATGAVTLRSTGGALRATGAVNGGSIALTAAGSVQADAGLAATGALSVDAGGTFTLAGTGRGATVSVTSADIALGAGAALGARGQTAALTLTNRNPANVTFVGGAAQPAGYSLDNAEAGRLFADSSITIGVALAGPAPPAGQATIEIGDLTLGYGAGRNLGTGGELEISSPARISITGDVALTTSGANDTFAIDPTLVELDSSTGSIAMLDAGGTPLGRLQIVGDTFAAASTAALPQLRTLTDMAAINALLDTPGGAGLPLRAGTITVTADDAFYVQNSGATALFPDRRGFAANGLDIVTGSPATRIVINGQIFTPAGAVSGLATAPLIRINGAAAVAAGQFDPASTINGCVIGSLCAPLPGGGLPTSTDIDSPVPPAEGPGALFVAPLIELAGAEPLISPPLVDEPITGVGNDDLWEPRCNPEEEDDGACPERDSRP